MENKGQKGLKHMPSLEPTRLDDALIAGHLEILPAEARKGDVLHMCLDHVDVALSDHPIQVQ